MELPMRVKHDIVSYSVHVSSEVFSHGMEINQNTVFNSSSMIRVARRDNVVSTILWRILRWMDKEKTCYYLAADGRCWQRSQFEESRDRILTPSVDENDTMIFSFYSLFSSSITSIDPLSLYVWTCKRGWNESRDAIKSYDWNASLLSLSRVAIKWKCIDWSLLISMFIVFLCILSWSVAVYYVFPRFSDRRKCNNRKYSRDVK